MSLVAEWGYLQQLVKGTWGSGALIEEHKKLSEQKKGGEVEEKREKFHPCQSQHCHLSLLCYVCGILLVVLNNFPRLYNQVHEMGMEAAASLVLRCVLY